MNTFPLGVGNVPPSKLKVFAPSGDTTEFTGWIAMREKYGQREVELFFLTDGGKESTLSRKVVILNQETGEVIYNPRRILAELEGKNSAKLSDGRFMTKSELTWLEKNPHWPDVLELYDTPTEEETDGLYPN